VIRDEAIRSICKICEEKPNLVRDKVYKHLLDMVGKSEFTTRVSACALFKTVYQYHTKEFATQPGDDEKFAEKRKALCKAYNEICNDDTPMVRRAAAHRMQDFVSVMELEDLTDEVFLNPFKTLAREETQDIIRVATVYAAITMAGRLNDADKIEYTIPVIRDASSDRSWRVRLTIAKNFDKLVVAFGPEITKERLMPHLLELLRDSEQEVRTQATKIIHKCLMPHCSFSIELQNKDQPNDVVRALEKLSNDAAQPVRAALADVLGPVSKAVGREVTQKTLLPLISDLMKDEFHDVRLSIVGHAGLFCEVLSVDGLVTHLLHTIQSLIMDNHWRIRRSVVSQVPVLADFFKIDMYQNKLESLFMSSLRDSVYSVRKEAILQLKTISTLFGPQWTVEHLLPKILELYSNSAGYANRVTTLQVVPQIWNNIHAHNNAESCTSILALLVKALKDSVPNVRVCACKMIFELLKEPDGRADAEHKLKPALKELEHDSDSDVQYFAQQAMVACQP